MQLDSTISVGHRTASAYAKEPISVAPSSGRCTDLGAARPTLPPIHTTTDMLRHTVCIRDGRLSLFRLWPVLTKRTKANASQAK
uniref:Uncharacterized protein n=1 Tax=Arundo donax TaxID=35708 RepID=A0A0A9H7H5_ARUDO